jgi:antirestriction protein ArdC
MNSRTPTVKRDLRQEITDNIIAALEKGTAPWQKPWQAGAFEMPMNPTSGKPYRGGNVIQLMMSGMKSSYEDPRWLTYRQAQENGWQVWKGEKGTQIEFWQFPKGKSEDFEESKSVEQDIGRDKPIYRVYTVFNASQIDGIPRHVPRVRQEWEANSSAETILQNSGARIIHDQADRAFYSRSTDSIYLPPRGAFDSAGNYYGTALHELVHYSGAPGRLNRETLNESYRFGDPNYAKEELRAELASVFIMAERGIPHNPDSHAAYLSSWIKTLQDDRHEIFRAARDAHRAADLIIALEHCKSMEEALAHINKPQSSIEQQKIGSEIGAIQSIARQDNSSIEMEF